jgi:uncharacterized SAM-binding protein YcdF (DUF218 family)
VDSARDTEDESQAVKKLVGDAPVALVTSAWHLPRSVGLFERAGVVVHPCPTHYLGSRNRDFRWEDVNWDSDSLGRSTAACHEWLGLLWNRLAPERLRASENLFRQLRTEDRTSQAMFSLKKLLGKRG